MLSTLISRCRLGVIASTLALGGGSPWTPESRADELVIPTTTGAFGNPRKTQVVEVVERVKACVVNIHSERTVSDAKSPFNSAKDLALTQHRVNGMGTGIVIDPRGYLITNYHVVDDVYLLRVRLHDGTSLPAKIIARDPENDLAVLKIDPAKPLPVIPLGTSSDLMLAEPVIAIGNAFGYEHTVTTGIVSALKRDVTLNKEVSYKSLIQTSAGINPGNSGGPLLNVHGELIGVNVAIRANAQNIAFALPIDQVLKTTSEMLAVRRRLGQSHGIVGRDMVDSSSNPIKRWVAVDSVEANSSAEQAGLKAGDVIEKLGDVPVKCLLDVERAYLESSPNAKLDVAVKRSGDSIKAELALRGNSRIVPAVPVSSAGGDVIWKKLGLRLEAVTPDSVTHVNKELRGGLLVKEVVSDGPAARAGFQRGDILIGLHQWETITSENVSFVLNHADLASFSPVRFFVVRGKELRRGWLPNFE
ncbi:trypsin-like peptidase domain-containing protein [Zavarzinella formosa]|uniref:trypsin-like peptidase domain-containing protein n=1 Tax=Zavarzinella formosa TaxID=360055 RepID=UPI00138AF935|nr:trypsin-like peptidase domain-containing protein [Zavarzinella formosa]